MNEIGLYKLIQDLKVCNKFIARERPTHGFVAQERCTYTGTRFAL